MISILVNLIQRREDQNNAKTVIDKEQSLILEGIEDSLVILVVWKNAFLFLIYAPDMITVVFAFCFVPVFHGH